MNDVRSVCVIGFRELGTGATEPFRDTGLLLCLLTETDEQSLPPALIGRLNCSEIPLLKPLDGCD